MRLIDDILHAAAGAFALVTEIAVIVLLMAAMLSFCGGCAHADRGDSWMRLQDGTQKRLCDLPWFVGASADTDPDQAEQTQASVDYWNEAIGARVFVWAGVLHDTTQETAQARGFWLVQFFDRVTASTGKGVGGLTDSGSWADGCLRGGHIKIKVVDETDKMQTVLRHELGHALGLSHDSGYRLMNHNAINLGPHPMEAHWIDIERLRRAYGQVQP